MGSVFGGHLALAGHDVTLVDTWREHMEAVAAAGLELRTPGGDCVIVPMRATHEPSRLRPVDLVIVLTKTFAGADALRSVAHAVTSGTWVVTVQNGLGNDRRLAESWVPQYPWTWSAAVLAGLWGLSLCILSTRVKSLDRLR